MGDNVAPALRTYQTPLAFPAGRSLRRGSFYAEYDVKRSGTMLASIMLAFAATTAEAQSRIGPHLGVQLDGGDFLIGAQATLPVATRVALYPSFDYYFVGGGASVWAVNIDLKFRPPSRYGFWYLGGGLNITGASGNTATGINLLTGWEGRRRATTPYLEAKLTLDGGSAFQIVAGVSFRMR
jgi:hypothetical protein